VAHSPFGISVVAGVLLSLCAAFAIPVGAHLSVSGTSFRRPDGGAFLWRGISAFRLTEFVAHGRSSDADAYLAWAAGNHLTVVRVFAMSTRLFRLSAADGQHALPELLDLAERRGLYVEVVALTDTADRHVDIPHMVKAVASICAAHDNCLLEIANEPGHPTQRRDLHDAAYVESLLPLVPRGVPVSLGSVEYGDGFAQGTYVTWHAPRSRPVESLDAAAALLKQFVKPVVSDEPIGAGAARIPGRRENDPEVFRQMARKARELGFGATFHYEGGLQARIPTGRELACFQAWISELVRP